MTLASDMLFKVSQTEVVNANKKCRTYVGGLISTSPDRSVLFSRSLLRPEYLQYRKMALLPRRPPFYVTPVHAWGSSMGVKL
jgi:hypothetical protein